jgi:hypothetical protein
MVSWVRILPTTGDPPDPVHAPRSGDPRRARRDLLGKGVLARSGVNCIVAPFQIDAVPQPTYRRPTTKNGDHDAVSCAFPTTSTSHDDVKVAEDIGYERAWLYDTPSRAPTCG